LRWLPKSGCGDGVHCRWMALIGTVSRFECRHYSNILVGPCWKFGIFVGPNVARRSCGENRGYGFFEKKILSIHQI
jgi:hypothetical protein